MVLALVAQHSFLSRLSQVWAYVTLGATSIFTEEAAPVVAGFAAHQGHLHAVRAAMACAIGSWAADIGLYLLGRWRALKVARSEEHTSELQSQFHLVCRLLLEK